MKYAIILALLVSGCVTSFEKKKTGLERDITILKLEIRKERLENELEGLEKE